MTIDLDKQGVPVAPRISIAMATYNGERYLEDQLDSILRQTLQPYELVVSDDGSRDRTIDVVERFAQRAPFPVRVYRNEVNLGFGGNFFRAASECRGDWISFSDQDDLWLPTKLSDCAEAIAKTSDLAMVLQKAKLCNEKLEWGGRMIPDSIRRGTYRPRSQQVFWIWFGFLQTIPRELLSLYAADLPISYCRGVDRVTHDAWACVMANAVGKIVVIDKPAALYRRHDAALTGYHQQMSPSEMLRLASQVGAEHYAYMADAAASNASYLRNIIAACPRDDWAAGLVAVAQDFDRMASIQRHRADLYRGFSLLRRLRSYVSIWTSGGYIGPVVTALGTKSAVKDFAQMITGQWS